MADLGALLAAIYGHPEDDAPRLVYADALLDLGDPRGEFIALQLQNPHSTRVRELVEQHGRAWLGGLDPIVQSFEFVRGFLDAIVIDVGKRIDLDDFAKLPIWFTIRTVHLVANGDHRARSVGKMQYSAILALGSAPGAETRTFVPALDEVKRAMYDRPE